MRRVTEPPVLQATPFAQGLAVCMSVHITPPHSTTNFYDQAYARISQL